MTVDLRGALYAASRISSSLKGSTKQFGWLQASATRNYSAAIGSEHLATIRIDSRSPQHLDVASLDAVRCNRLRPSRLIVTNRDNQHRKRRVLDRVVMTVLGFIRDGLLTRSA